MPHRSPERRAQPAAARPEARGPQRDAASRADALADDPADPNTFDRISARTMLRLFWRDRVAVELALLTGWAPPDCADDAAAVRREARAALPPEAPEAEVDAEAITRLWAEPARWAGATPGPNTWRVQVTLGGTP